MTTRVTFGNPPLLKGFACNGMTRVTLGRSGTILTSPGGANWTQQVFETEDAMEDVVWSGTQFVAVGETQGHSFPADWINPKNVALARANGPQIDTIMRKVAAERNKAFGRQSLEKAAAGHEKRSYQSVL